MFTVTDEGEIIYGLGAIKGLGEGPIENIVEARSSGGEFNSLFDFCARTNARKVNRRAIEALIRSGAFDGFSVERSVLMASLGDALQAAQQQANNEDAGMDDMFGDVVKAASNTDVYGAFRNVRPWSPKKTLAGEKDTLGLWITGHPFDEYEAELRQFAPQRIADLRAEGSKTQVVAGLIESIRTMKTKRGDTMAILSLDDRSARIEVTVFADVYNENREMLIKDSIVIVEGTVGHDDYSGGLSVRSSSISSLLQARQSRASELTIELREELVNEQLASQLENLLSHARGGCRVAIWYNQGENRARIRFGETWQVSPSDELIQQLRDVCGNQSVSLNYRRSV